MEALWKDRSTQRQRVGGKVNPRFPPFSSLYEAIAAPDIEAAESRRRSSSPTNRTGMLFLGCVVSVGAASLLGTILLKEKQKHEPPRDPNMFFRRKA